MSALLRDLRYSLRLLLRKPAFTLIAIVTLGLGIGVNTAIFSCVYGLMFRPLPGAERPQELVSITLTEGKSFPYNLSYASYKDYLSLDDVFDDAIAGIVTNARLRVGSEPAQRIAAALVTGNYFDMLGVRPMLGSNFTAEESRQMGAGQLLVLDHETWESWFLGDPGVIGSVVQINGQPFTIIGVAPEAFRGTWGFMRATSYMPLSAIDVLIPGSGKTLEDRARSGAFQVLARLRPGVSLSQAQAATLTHSARLDAAFTETQGGQRALISPEPHARMEPAALSYMPPIAAVFITLVSLVLLIACANVANLLLARATGRSKELAIRSALGAGRWPLLRQSLCESLLIALAGGGLGLALARWGTSYIASIRPAVDLPLQLDFSLDTNIFLYALAIAVLTGLVSGLAPAIQASRTDPIAGVKEGGRSSGGGGRHRLRSVLVVSQVAVSLVLLICAGLFYRTTLNVTDIDFGFEMENKLVVAMDTDMRQYDEARSRIFYRDLLARARAMPGVIDAALGHYLPVGFDNGIREIFLEGVVPEKDEAPPWAYYNAGSPAYFRVMGMPLLQGRPFSETDAEETTPVAIVNDTMAQRFWPGENPVGRRFRITRDGKLLQVVGVTRTVKFALPAERPVSGVYLPLEQYHRTDNVLHVRTAGDPLALAPRVRTEIQALDPEMPYWDLRTLETHIREGKVLLFNLAAELVSAFGVIGMALACIGLYGVMAYSISQRTHEIGVRMALGASRGSILSLMIGRGMTWAVIGVGIGLLGALFVTPMFANLLVGVTARDPWTFAGVALLLVAVALLAAYLPSRRATRVDAVVALRCE